MRRDIKEKWVAELRSGKYKQGTGYLRRNDEFCCLGVLCELAVADEVIAPAVAPTVSKDYYRYLAPLSNTYIDEHGTAAPDGFGFMYANLPEAVRDWAGLDLRDQGIELDWPEDHEFYGLNKGFTDLNDEDRWTFAQIADAIEKYVPVDEDVVDAGASASSEGEGTTT